MPPVGFEPTISAGDRPQTYALDRAATGTGTFLLHKLHIVWQETRHNTLILKLSVCPSTDNSSIFDIHVTVRRDIFL